MKSKNSKLKIIFIGFPKFGAIILEKLVNKGYKPILVVTGADKPSGRKRILTPSEVKLAAEKYRIPALQPQKIKEIGAKIKCLKPDLIIVASFGQIIPKEILETSKHGSLNIHPSLLPEYRGPSPIQTFIARGGKKTGVTIYLMDEKIDHGPVIIQKKWEAKSPETINKIRYEELLKELAVLGAKLLIEAIPKWTKGKIKPKAQNHSKASYTKIIEKEDGRIDWKKTAQEIERQIRAFELWPSSFTFWSKKGKRIRIKVLKADVLKLKGKSPVAKVSFSPDKKLLVKCGKDFLIIKKLQQEGKSPTTSEDFLRGNSDFIGVILK